MVDRSDLNLVMIAQWENERFSLSVLTVATERTDSEIHFLIISLSILFVTWVQFPAMEENFKGFFHG